MIGAPQADSGIDVANSEDQSKRSCEKHEDFLWKTANLNKGVGVVQSQLSGIRRAFAGLRHDYFKEVPVAILKAFIDDSGSGGDSPWFVLGGYVGTAEAWDKFDHHWRAVLDGPPKLEYFKASQAESLRPDGQWAGISKNERNQRIDSLIKVIGNHALRSIYVRLKQQDYNEVIKPYVPDAWDNAYYYLFIGSIAAFTSVEKHVGANQPIEFFFDRQNALEKPSNRLYSMVGNQLFGNRVVDVHYEDEKLFLPLQAADLLAWQLRRRFSMTDEPKRPHFENALLCPPEKPFEYLLTRKHLEEMGEFMDQNAKVQWALMGQQESQRPWKRPAKL